MGSQTNDAEKIFHQAADIQDPQQRRAFLEKACAGNPDLRKDISALLRHDDAAGSFLQQPALAVDSSGPHTHSTDAETIGAVIGPYTLREQIGEGGFGVVYVAEQTEPLRRKVALKLIKPGMDTKQVIARFDAERHALALMDHPNIARVLDAGAADSGRPYFVMEFVRGIPITEYCDKARLTPRSRLELFVLVCQAVQHAHQKGIIHRDIKPSNVLVTLHDGTPVPKVIDFGVAKAINQRLTEQTVYTQAMQMVGTPLYMSPEQAELSGLDIDTRTAIYSLGVLLYELLSGDTPFDKQILRQAGFDELRRIIREEEPPRPSVRISTLQAHDLSTVSQRRQLDARKLSHQLRGELDWIVMKALEKDRARRYESASAFAGDVNRHLNGDSVQACPPSARYRLKKFARRNKTMIATTALVGSALITGVIGTAWQALRATDERNRAVFAEQQALKQAQRADKEAAAAKFKTLILELQQTRRSRVGDWRTDAWELVRPGRASRRRCHFPRQRRLADQRRPDRRLGRQDRRASAADSTKGDRCGRLRRRLVAGGGADGWADSDLVGLRRTAGRPTEAHSKQDSLSFVSPGRSSALDGARN